ncbi:MAG: hypothetical protein J0M10_02820 [Chitinophagales bacterium]|nr:hypothetical protein [Chitinophagales bacterium]
MAQSNKLIFSIDRLNTAVIVLLAFVIFSSCNSQASHSATKTLGMITKEAPESHTFTSLIIETNNGRSKAEIDTVTGYRK